MDRWNRPIVWSTVYFVLGIIGGALLRNKGQWTLFFLVSFAVISLVSWCVLCKKWSYCICLLFMMLGVGRLINHPILYEANFLCIKPSREVMGTVQEVRRGEFSDQVILADVQVDRKRLDSKLLVKLPSGEKVTIGQILLCKGRAEVMDGPMNPSDYDFKGYMQSQGVCAGFDAVKVQVKGEKWHIIQSIRERLSGQITKLFYPGDKGIINLLVLGEKQFVDDAIQNAYYGLGIGHILTISGVHITLIIAGIWMVLGYCNVNYTRRHVIVLALIWGYAFLAGLGVSTVRACLVATILGIGRCFWQEDDLLTSLAIAGFCILYSNPFALGQVGFQLSFGAMIGVIVAVNMAQAMQFSRNLPQWMVQLLGTVIISLVIFPVLGYHFFKISLIGVVLNIIFIPAFGIILPSSFIVIGLSYFNFKMAFGIAKILTWVLESLNGIALGVMKLPFAVWDVGRPSVENIVLYYLLLGAVLWLGYQRLLRSKCSIYGQWLIVGVLSIWAVGGLSTYWNKGSLEITQLYIGQGDAGVILTPHGQAILIDSGVAGKGQTIQQFLSYKGKSQLDLVIISHPHDDHIGGLLELLETDIRIKGIVVGKVNQSNELLSQLKEKCQRKNVPIYELDEDRLVVMDEVKMKFFVSKGDQDLNEASLVCQLTYGAYDELFTGDIGFGREAKIGQFEDVDVLKVAHHGSGYSTSDDFLLQTKPEYGIISCGIHNRYNHPHEATLDRMAQHELEVLSTHEVGAVEVITDGDVLKISNQLQKESIGHDVD